MMAALPGTTGRRRLYLMRHGFVDYTSREVVEARDPSIARLTEQGRAEARAAGVALSDITFDLALCSGLARTRETAEIVLAEHPEDIALEDEPRFEELRSGQYINFESAEQLAATMTFQFEQAGEPGATFLEGGEAFRDAHDRITDG
ncbi:MAG: histidine phosphatase family protein, partial [Pseudomonadota bacterium]